MSLIFKDKEGRNIILTNERMKHISKHIQISTNIHFIEETLKDPEIIKQDEFQENKFYYQRYIKKEGLYFVLILKLEKDEGSIITVYKSKKIKY